MRVFYLLPTGGRAESALATCQKWLEQMPVVVYTWDTETRDKLSPFCDIYYGEKLTFPKAINYLASQLDFDALVCGSDNLLPAVADIPDLIEMTLQGGTDAVIWADDGLMRAQATHPIVGRQWYDRHGYILDEGFNHYFCDTDLHFRAKAQNKLIKNFDIKFDHCQELSKNDSLWNWAQDRFWMDKEYFEGKHSVRCQLLKKDEKTLIPSTR